MTLDLTSQIETLAGKPVKVGQRGGRVIEQQNIRDLAEAMKTLRDLTVAESTAATKPGAGLRFQQITPVYR